MCYLFVFACADNFNYSISVTDNQNLYESTSSIHTPLIAHPTFCQFENFPPASLPQTLTQTPKHITKNTTQLPLAQPSPDSCRAASLQFTQIWYALEQRTLTYKTINTDQRNNFSLSSRTKRFFFRSLTHYFDIPHDYLSVFLQIEENHLQTFLYTTVGNKNFLFHPFKKVTQMSPLHKKKANL